MSIAVLPKRKSQSRKKEEFEPYFQTDSAMLFVGDCMEIMRSLPEDFVDMVFADPPYNLSNGGITCYAGQRVSVNKGDWDKSRGFQDDTEFHDSNVENR